MPHKKFKIIVNAFFQDVYNIRGDLKGLSCALEEERYYSYFIDFVGIF